MGDLTGIEWCDSTFNPWTGCTKVSPACDHCYAEASMGTRLKRVTWGAGQERQRTSVQNWKQPVRWNSQPFVQCDSCGWRGEKKSRHACPVCGGGACTPARRRVFCASLADVFDNEVPGQWRRDLFDLIRATPNLDWLLLTKRIGNALRMLPWAAEGAPGNMVAGSAIYPNVWLGATIVNQEEADRDIPKLLTTPAAVRFLSMEPLLAPVDLTQIDDGAAHRDVPREEWGTVDDEDSPPGLWWNVLTGQRTIMHGGATGDWSRTDSKVDWVIAGGESGHGARPMHPDWVRSLRDQCEAAGVAFLMKQWGEWGPTTWEASRHSGALNSIRGDDIAFTVFGPAGRQVAIPVVKVGKKAAGRLLDGKTHDGFPEVRHG